MLKKIRKTNLKENRWSSFWRRACWEVEKESTWTMMCNKRERKGLVWGLA
jgi:hypothetical protein